MQYKTIIAAVLSGCLFLCGCGVADLENSETTDDLARRYDRDFTLISSGETPRKNRRYLDDRMEMPAETQEDAHADDSVDVYEDADGIRFHVFHTLRYGVANSWVIVDDYNVQYLMSQPEVYAPLEQSAYDCTYYNTIGMSDACEAGFQLTVFGLADIRPAAELAFDVIGNVSVLPIGEENTSFRYSIVPEITLIAGEKLPLCSASFRTEWMPQGTDLENFIRSAEEQYIAYVNDGDLTETLPETVLHRRKREEIPIFADGRQIAALTADEWNRTYAVEDSAEFWGEMEFPQLKRICAYAGYTYTPDGDRLHITKGEDIILIRRTRMDKTGTSSDRSEYTLWKNGSQLAPEGILEGSSTGEICRLTLADYAYLFGVTMTVDYEKGTAVLAQ